MFFNVYTTANIQTDEIRAKLNDILERYQCNDRIDSEKIRKIRLALEVSNNNPCASRYGLSQVMFAETELLNALECEGAEVEFLNYRYDFKDIPMNHKKSEFPLVLAIEASSLCNLKCRMCFQKNRVFTSNPANMGVMKWEVFVKLMNQIGQDQLRSIVFASRGEPLINKNIHKMVELAKRKGVLDIKLNTNAVLLDERMSRNLLKSGLDQIVFSVDSAIPQHYKNIRGADFEVVSRNIKRFVDIKNSEFPDSKIKTRVSMVINDIYKDDMEQEVEVSKEYWGGIIDEVAFKSENDFVGIYEERHMEGMKCCDLLWERLYVWQDGTVNPCDIDHLSTLKLGNICERSIIDIWNGELITKLREQHLRSRESMKCVCKNCVGY